MFDHILFENLSLWHEIPNAKQNFYLLWTIATLDARCHFHFLRFVDKARGGRTFLLSVWCFCTMHSFGKMVISLLQFTDFWNRFREEKFSFIQTWYMDLFLNLWNHDDIFCSSVTHHLFPLFRKSIKKVEPNKSKPWMYFISWNITGRFCLKIFLPFWQVCSTCYAMKEKRERVCIGITPKEIQTESVKSIELRSFIGSDVIRISF